VTVAVVRASVDPYDVELGYKRAAYADSENADILRQYETFALEYDKLGRGDLITPSECSVCVDDHQCETCFLFKKFENELKLMPASLGARRHVLKDIADYLLVPKYPRIELPPLPVKVRASRWKEAKEKLVQNLDPRKWLGYLLMESEREQALRLQPLELYGEVKEEIGIKDVKEEDDFDRQVAERNKLMIRKKRRGKGVFVTHTSQGPPIQEQAIKVLKDAPDAAGRSPYPRTVIAANEKGMTEFEEANKVEVVNVSKIIEGEERQAFENRFFGQQSIGGEQSLAKSPS
jgi:hypothetical protein